MKVDEAIFLNNNYVCSAKRAVKRNKAETPFAGAKTKRDITISERLNKSGKDKLQSTKPGAKVLKSHSVIDLLNNR